MSRQLIDRSPDLKRLRDEGYDVDIREGYLLVKDVPYLGADKKVKRGVLISKLELANDVTAKPDDHVAFFAGEFPCHKDGSPIERIRCGNSNIKIGDIQAAFSFSAKPKPSDRYENYYAKMSTYADILSGAAQMIDPAVTAKTFPVIAATEEGSVFKYLDTATSRAELTDVAKKLALRKVGIFGVGGTGGYVLDLIAKAPIVEIHLFDGDIFLQHNAFRAPGAASGAEIEEKVAKVIYYKRIYSKMRDGIVPHAKPIDQETLERYADLDFVFLCMEGAGKKAIVRKLEELKIPFVDVGMGVYVKNGVLGGLLRTTTSTPAKRDHVWAKNRIPFADGVGDNEYDKNIQINDLNALNAALAARRKIMNGLTIGDARGEQRPIEIALHKSAGIAGQLVREILAIARADEIGRRLVTKDPGGQADRGAMRL